MGYEGMDLGWHNGEELQDAEDIAAGLNAIVDDSLLHSAEALDRWVSNAFARLTPAEAESAMNALRDLGRAVTSKEVRQVVGGALPVAGGIVGTVYGGPAGAAIGGSLGQAAGQFVSGGAGKAAPSAAQAPAPAMATAPLAPQPAPQGGSQAAGQLLHLVQDPAVVQSLLALVMGAQGKTTVPVGEQGKQVPVGALMNLIGTLASRAAEDAEQIVMAGHAAGPAYLRDDEGNYICDPAAPTERAEALLRLIDSADEHLYSEW